MSKLRRRAQRSDQIDHSISSWSRRRVLSWTLFVLAGLIMVQHLVAHAGFRPLPISMGWQDTLIGYPTAAVLALAGLFSLDPNPKL